MKKMRINYGEFSRWIKNEMKKYNMPIAHFILLYDNIAEEEKVEEWINGYSLPNAEQWDLIAYTFSTLRSRSDETEKSQDLNKAIVLMEMSKTLTTRW